jgi:hypothetical protein
MKQSWRVTYYLVNWRLPFDAGCVGTQWEWEPLVGGSQP